jgi:hypothetical protein
MPTGGSARSPQMRSVRFRPHPGTRKHSGNLCFGPRGYGRGQRTVLEDKFVRRLG